MNKNISLTLVYDKNPRLCSMMYVFVLLLTASFLFSCSDSGNTKAVENSLFGSSSGDNVPPTITSMNPADAAANVPVTAALTVTFSKDIDPETVNASTFTIVSGSSSVAGSVTYDPGAKAATFTPTGILAYSSSYTITLTRGIRDTSGNAMANAVTCSFTTEAPPTSVPEPPSSVTATAGDKQVTISWNAVNGATSYNIYWSITSNVSKTSGTKITNVKSPYTKTGLTNGTAYYFVVTATNLIAQMMLTLAEHHQMTDRLIQHIVLKFIQ